MFDTVRQIFRFLFSDQIRLRHSKQEGIHIALTPAGSLEVSDSMLRRQSVERKAAALLQSMQHELRAVLRSPGSRREQTRHLAALDAALHTQGLLVLKAMPLPQLCRALAEFERAVSNWSPVGLATLRSKIAVAVAERRRAGESDVLPVASSTAAAIDEGIPEVTEVALPSEAMGDPSAALLAAYAGLANAETTATSG